MILNRALPINDEMTKIGGTNCAGFSSDFHILYSTSCYITLDDMPVCLMLAQLVKNSFGSTRS